jgi:hypothetical protein
MQVIYPIFQKLPSIYTDNRQMLWTYPFTLPATDAVLALPLLSQDHYRKNEVSISSPYIATKSGIDDIRDTYFFRTPVTAVPA